MRVRIKMHEHAGVVGEDRTDWLGGEEHECSPHFARHLVARGMAYIIEASPERAETPGIQHGDPAIESRDPSVGLDASSAAAIVSATGRSRRR